MFKEIVMNSVYQVKLRFLIFAIDLLYDYLDLELLQQTSFRIKFVLESIEEEVSNLFISNQDLITKEVERFFLLIFKIDLTKYVSLMNLSFYRENRVETQLEKK